MTSRTTSSTAVVVFHRHPLGGQNGNHRVVCIEEVHFGQQGLIQPMKPTTQGVTAQPLVQ